MLALAVTIAPVAATAAGLRVTATHTVAIASDGTWRSAFQVPGLSTLDVGANGQVNGVSCVAPGSCVAGGNLGGPSGTEPFLAEERDGVWGSAFVLPGAASLGGSNPAIEAVSCTAPGDCAAAGTWTNGSSQQDVFVTDERDGAWGDAHEVPGIQLLATGGGTYLSALSCAAPGDCAVGGQYVDGSSRGQAWVDGETDGAWGNAIEVPGTAALNAGGGAGVNALSCGAPGACTSAGQYLDGSSNTQVFLDGEPWSAATEAPGTGALNAGGNDSIYAISCAAAGDCSAGGYYTTAGLHRRAFVVDEHDGVWGDAIDVPGVDALDVDGYGSVDALSCHAPGDCTAAGVYHDASGRQQAFADDEVDGTWGSAAPLPGLAGLNAGGDVQVSALSCGAPGTCALGGSYEDAGHASQAFVDHESGGSWRAALEAPGTAGLNTGGAASVRTVSCPSAGACLAGGQYGVAPSGHHAFLVAFVTPAPAISTLGPAIGPTRGGTRVVLHGRFLSGATRVSFGARTARILTASDTGIVAIAPPGHGIVGVVVTTPGGSSATTARTRYTYEARPTVRSLSPSTGPAAGGTIITIHGAALLGATQVRFGTRLGVRVRVRNANELQVTTPPGRLTVTVRVTTPGGTSSTSIGARYRYAAATATRIHGAATRAGPLTKEA